MSYLWPLLLGTIVQLVWNGVGVFFLWDSSAFGNWYYARSCDWGYCDGKILVIGWWIAVLLLIIGNSIYQWSRHD